jgi:hypothetical protein
MSELRIDLPQSLLNIAERLPALRIKVACKRSSGIVVLSGVAGDPDDAVRAFVARFHDRMIFSRRAPSWRYVCRNLKLDYNGDEAHTIMEMKPAKNGEEMENGV